VTRAGALVLAALAAGGLSCKVSLTPESLAKTYTAIKDARKDLTPENEYYVGRSVATNLLARANYKYVEADAFAGGQLGPTTAYVNAVGNVIAAAAMETTRKGDRPSPIAGWHFVIVDDDVINAVSAPGGYIMVNRGLIQAAKSEDQLAAVLAHEVAHVIRGHALGSIKKSRWANVGKEFLDSSVELDAAALGNLTQAFEGAMDDMIDSLVVKGYSRDTEFEADKVGLQILVKAGYNPQAFVELLRTLDKVVPKTGTTGMGATHPKPADRIAKLEKEVGKQKKVAVPEARTARFNAAVAALSAGGAPATDTPGLE
jgi:beta-barrel assembly-enhancing protease